MYEENLHITPGPKKGFPQPEIPADEAWNKMAELLDTEMPLSPPGPAAPTEPPSPAAGGRILGGSSYIWGIVIGVLGFIGILTWVVISFTGKPESPALINDTVNMAQNSMVTDSLAANNQNSSFSPGKALSPEKNYGFDEMKEIAESRSAVDDSIQSGVVYQPGILSQPGAAPQAVSEPKFEKEPDAAVAAVTNSPEQDTIKPRALEPAEPGTGNIAASGSINPSSKPVPDANAPSNAAGGGIPSATESPSVPEKSGRSPGLSENLTWQTGIYGNIGQVVQHGRDPNMFYGGMVTGGLWNKKIKAGIETGIGWEAYHDYGSVTENLWVADSIPIDTLGGFQYIDTNRITAYDYQYQYLQVPLFISKQVFSKGRLSLDIKTGPVMGIMVSERKTLDYISGPEYGEILGTVDNDYSRLKISWQWHLTAQLRWDFNKRLSLTVSPFGIFYLNNLYESQNRPSNTPFGIGIYGGLIYRIK